MAKIGINQVTTAQTFQTWLDRTNDIVNIIGSDAMTASALGDTTVGNATLVGSFTANTIITQDILRTDAISPKIGSTSISITSPVSITGSAQTVQTLNSSTGPRSLYSSGSLIWSAGFENTSANRFMINTGTGAPKFALSPSGDLNIAGSLFLSDIATMNGNVIGDVTGNVTVPNGGTLDASNASNVSLPGGFGLIPTGGIIMWSGSVVSIPVGWALCNGQNGTPDLRDRFVVGAGNSYSVGDTGGAESVTLTSSNIPSHSHSFSATTGSAGSHSHTGSAASAGSHSHTGSAASAGSHSHTGLTTSAGVHRHAILNQDNQGSFGAWVGAFLAKRNSFGGSENYNLNGTFTEPTVGLTSPDGSHQHTLSINSGGAHTHSVTIGAAGSHTHSVTINDAGAHTHTVSGTTGTTGGGTAHENRPPYYALAYIMKT